LTPSLVATQPDRPAGRGLQTAPPAVKLVALTAGLPVIQPEKITAEIRERIVAERPDVIVVAAYGKILRPALLAAPPLGCLNAHASLLPAYRGAAPVNWAICNGETQTGVTIMKMDEGVDTGPILAQTVVSIAPEDNAASLLDKLAAVAGPLMAETLRRWARGEISAAPQPADGVSYAPMLKKEDGRLDWRQSARRVVDRVRGMSPWPGAYTTWRGKTLKVLRAEAVEASGEPGVVIGAKKELLVAAREGAARLLTLQLEGKKALDAAAFLNGAALRENERLGE
jgi:methionyl-tRNA formyltransferase